MGHGTYAAQWITTKQKTGLRDRTEGGEVHYFRTIQGVSEGTQDFLCFFGVA
jgi:hypothetical protein